MFILLFQSRRRDGTKAQRHMTQGRSERHVDVWEERDTGLEKPALGTRMFTYTLGMTNKDISGGRNTSGEFGAL